MRPTLALWIATLLLACGGAAGLAAPAALASGSGGGVTVSTPSTASPLGSGTQPSFNLNNAGASAPPQTTTVSSSPATGASSSGGGISTGGAVIIAVVVAALMAGIVVLVRNDARSHLAKVAHGGHDDPLAGQRAHAGSKAARKPRKLKPAERKRRKRGRAR